MEQIMIQMKGKHEITHGRYTPENESWLYAHNNEVFTAVREGLNYYKLSNGYECHIYECSKIKKTSNIF